MAMLWMDGFQWIADTTTGLTLEDLFKERYFNANMDAGGTDSIIDASQPGPGHSLKMGNASNQGDWLWIDTGGSDEIYFSARCYFNDLASAGGTNGLLQFRGNASNLEHIDVNLGTNGEWRVTRVGSQVALRTPLPGMNRPAHEWFTIEMYVKVGNSDGAWELKINGVTVGSQTNVDTEPISNPDIDQIIIRSNSSAVGPFWRDIIIHDGTGTVNNSWVGQNKHVYMKLPNADTATEDWTLSTGTDSFALIDEVNNDGGTTYIESSTATNQTYVEIEASGSEANITAISVHTTAALDAAGSETFDDVVKEGATTTNSTAHTVDSTTYAQFTTVYDTNPDTAAAWDSTEIDALQIGVEKN